MYGPLLVTIILAPIFLIALTLAILPEALASHYRNKCQFWDGRSYRMEFSTFFNGATQIEYLKKDGREDELKELQAAYKKKELWDAFPSAVQGLAVGITVIVGIALFIFALISIINPLCVKQEVAYWENFIEMVELTINSASDYQTVGIAGDIINYNSWLAGARTSQEVWGNWSSYHNIDLSQLEYITIGQ
jgi:hypothetical protein